MRPTETISAISGSGAGTVILAAAQMLPILLLGLVTLGKWLRLLAGHTATPERAATDGGWLAPWPGRFTGNELTLAEPPWITEYG